MPDKKLRLSLLGLSLIALMLLASGLNQLVLSPGQPFIIQETDGRPTLPPTLIMSLVLVSVVLFLFLAVLLIPNGLWRQGKFILLTLLMLSLSCLILMWLTARPTVDYVEPTPIPLVFGEDDDPSITPTPSEALPPPELQPIPEPPRWFAPLVSFLLTLLLLGGAGGLFWWWRNQQAMPPEKPLEALAREAQTALDSLDSGADWTDVIVRCYAGMEQAMQTEHEVARSVGMTPQEFAAELVALGLPAEPIATLTGLFEATRYGGQTADADQQALATKSLAAIVAAVKQEV